MKALVVDSFGPPDMAQMRDWPAPTPGAGEVRVEVHAMGINFPDLLTVAGRYQNQPQPPFVPGKEAAGCVVEIGAGVRHLAVGDRVMLQLECGAFAEEVVVVEEHCFRIPDSLPMVKAAAMGLTYQTAWFGLFDRASLQPGETVFVTGNPGSTGRLDTIAQMEFLRDLEYPAIIRQIDGRLKQLRKHKDDDSGEDIRGEILNLENSYKAYVGYLDGLKTAVVMETKRKAEQELREAVAKNTELTAKIGDPWKRIEEIVAEKREIVRTRKGFERFQQLDQEIELLAKRVGEAFFAVYGTKLPPDATFTLRLSDGVVKGYPMNGTLAPFFTSLYGMYARNAEFGGKDPFALEPAWLDKIKELDMTTPFCLVSTCDIIGGNSGSPMIDSNLNVVGLVFDGNIESLGNRFIYTDAVARTVCVHPAMIVEALRKIYGAGKLADEFEGKGTGY